MSQNITERKRERLPVAQLKTMGLQQSARRTIQYQGTQATRVGVVEGFLRLPLNVEGEVPFVDIEAPVGSTIMVGSLVSTTYLVVGPLGPGSPFTIMNWDVRNANWGESVVATWMTYAGTITDPDDAYDLTSVQAFRIPDNKIRVQGRVIWRQGIGATPALIFYIYFQLRMTMNWSQT